MNRIGEAGEGGRESCAASPGAAIRHPRPHDAAAAVRVGRSPRRIRSAPRPGGGTARRRGGRPRPSAARPWERRAGSPNCRFGFPLRPRGAPARLFRVPTPQTGVRSCAVCACNARRDLGRTGCRGPCGRRVRRPAESRPLPATPWPNARRGRRIVVFHYRDHSMCRAAARSITVLDLSLISSVETARCPSFLFSSSSP